MILSTFPKCQDCSLNPRFFSVFVHVSPHSSVPSWESWVREAVWSRSKESWRTLLSSPGFFLVRFEATSSSAKRSTPRSMTEFWEPAPSREWESLLVMFLIIPCPAAFSYCRLERFFILSSWYWVQRNCEWLVRLEFGPCSGHGHVARWWFGDGRGQRGQTQWRPEGKGQLSKVCWITLQYCIYSLWCQWGR